VKITFHNGPSSETDPDPHFQGNWEVDLTGDEGEWTITVTGPGKYEKWEGEWDHTTKEIVVMALNTQDLALSYRLIHASQMFLRSHIEKVFVADQKSLDFTREQGCCQCGQTETVHPIKGFNDGATYSKPEKVTWCCTVCNGLVCRNCCLTVPGSKPEKYYDNTLCSLLCLASATPMVAWESKMEVSGPFSKVKRA